MKILGIDSSADTAAVAIVEDGKIISSFTGNMKKTHSNTLLPIVKNLLDYSGISVSEIDLYSVSVGPGSFTGIRIGVATVKGLAFSNNTPVAGVSTLEAMAYAYCDREGSVVCPVLNARRGDVYYALFKIENGKPRRLADDDSINSKSLEQLLSDYPSVVFTGDGVSVLQANFEKREVMSVNELLSYPHGYGVCIAGMNAMLEGRYIFEKELAPVYLKPAQAERERNEKLRKTVNN